MIKVNVDKAKEITHEIRRSVRAEEFAPLDKDININIANPTKIAEVEAQRQAIRDKHTTFQESINGCETVDQLKAIIADMKG